jgi:hypothetical protein
MVELRAELNHFANLVENFLVLDITMVHENLLCPAADADVAGAVVNASQGHQQLTQWNALKQEEQAGDEGAKYVETISKLRDQVYEMELTMDMMLAWAKVRRVLSHVIFCSWY